MIPATIAPKVARLIPMLSTDNDGEALAACRALGRMLAGAGSSFHDLAATVAQPVRAAPAPKRPKSWSEQRGGAELRPWRELVRRCQSYASRLNERDREFMWDMTDLLEEGRMPSAKQRAWLSDLEAKVDRWAYRP